MALFPRLCVLRRFPAAASEQKMLIYELETHRAHLTRVDGHPLYFYKG